MRKVTEIDIDTLKDGDVLLIDTDDANLKLIVTEEIQSTLAVQQKHAHVYKLNEEEIEEEFGIAYTINPIKKGKPVRFTNWDNMGKTFNTSPVRVIEIYES